MMCYKGHTGSTEYCGDSQVWHGRVLHTRDLVTYEAPTKELLAPEFARAVDDYIETRSELSK